MRSKIIAILIPAMLMLFLVGITFDRLVLGISGVLPGSSDTSGFTIWHLWWPMYSFAVPDGVTIHAYNGTPYLSNSLRYTPILQSFAFGVLSQAANPFIGINIVLICSFSATWFVMVRYFMSKQIPLWLGMSGASAFVLTGWYYDVLTQADVILASMWVMPLAFLTFDRWLCHRTYWRMLLVVLVLYIGVLSGIQHLAWITGLWLPYAIIQIRTYCQNSDDDLLQFRRQTFAMAVIGAILIFIYPTPAFVRAMQGYAPAFTPTADLPESSSLTRFIFDISPPIWLFAGTTIFFTRPNRQSYFWLIMALLTLLWASGLILDPIRLLMAGMRLTPSALYSQTVYFSISAFALIIFIMLSWNDLVLMRRAITGFVFAIVSVLLVAFSPALRREFPVHHLQIEPFYTNIAAEPEDHLLLEYPFGIVSLIDGRTLGTGAGLVGNAVWHHKRTMSGIAPFYSDGTFDNFQEMSFLFPESLEDNQIDTAARNLAIAVKQWRIGYVIVHSDLVGSGLRNLDLLINDAMVFCSPFQSGVLTIYRARWHPGGCDQEGLN